MHFCKVLIIAIMAVCSTRAAVILTPSITTSDTEFSYNYTITNTETLGIIAIDLSIPVAPTSVSAPADWITNIFDNGTGFVVQWISTTSEIAPNTSLSDFIVVSPGVPGTVSFSATDSDLDTISGTTTGPSAVPEPASISLVSIAVALMMMRGRVRRDYK